MKIGNIEIYNFGKHFAWWAVKINLSGYPRNGLVRWCVQIGPFGVISKRQHVECMICGEVIYYDTRKPSPHPCANKKDHD